MDARLEVSENSAQIFNITAIDIDGDISVYEWYLDGNLISGATTYSHTYLPGFNDSGSHSIINVVIDLQGLNATHAWGVNVVNTNRAPHILDISPLTALEDNLSSFNVSAIDDNGDLITYSVNDSRFSVTKVNNTLAIISWMPTNDTLSR